MRSVGSVKEDLATEKRISITPESVKKFIDLGFTINLEKKYAEHLGINDEDYKKMVQILIFQKKRFLTNQK